MHNNTDSENDIATSALFTMEKKINCPSTAVMSQIEHNHKLNTKIVAIYIAQIISVFRY